LRAATVLVALAALLAFLPAAGATAQDAPAPEPTRAPEGPRIINLPSADAPAAGTLGVLFTHRFKGPLNASSARDLYTIDSGADSVIGASYSPWDRLEISLDRSSLDATFELAAKYQFTSIEPNRPFALALRVGGNAVTAENADDREAFFTQGIASLLLGRRVRLTAIPTYVSNTALFRDVFNVPVALSVAITRTVNIHGEIYPKNGDFTERPSSPTGPGRQTHIGWIASVEKTVLRHRFAFTVGNMRGTTVDQYTASDIGGSGVPHDTFFGFNLVRQWKLK
jgi:hypothetical protein